MDYLRDHWDCVKTSGRDFKGPFAHEGKLKILCKLYLDAMKERYIRPYKKVNRSL